MATFQDKVLGYSTSTAFMATLPQALSHVMKINFAKSRDCINQCIEQKSNDLAHITRVLHLFSNIRFKHNSN